MKFFSGNFNGKVGREDVLKPKTGNEILHEISNEMELRVVNFATSKNLTVKSKMFPHRNIYKFTWTSTDGKNHNQIDHILIDSKRHSYVLDRSVQQIVILTPVWWWQELGTDCQSVNRQHANLFWRGSTSRN
jgi:hypothetical protein